MKRFQEKARLTCLLAVLVCLMACGASGGSQKTDEKTDAPETTVLQQEGTEKSSVVENVESIGGQDVDAKASVDTGKTDTGKTDAEKIDAKKTDAEKADVEKNVTETEMVAENSKVLVAYFSATGTTKRLAEYAADVMRADLYEIVPEEPYTDHDLNYSDRTTRATVEQNDKTVRPAISGSVENMDQYEIVFLAFPIWWGEEPRIMDTFVETYDFSGKTVIPFCTSGSSGIGSSGRNMQSLSKGDGTWLDGARLGSSSSREDMADWINSLGLDVEAK